ncbi:hypothetical protein Dimus_006692 [Dionaea muscipula]
MKDDDHQSHRHPQLHRRRSLLNISGTAYTKPTAYIILLLLFYTLGYFSATFSFNDNSKPNPSISSPASQTKWTDHPTAAAVVLPSSSDADHNRFDTRCASPVRPDMVRKTILDRIFNGTSPYDDFPPAHINGLLKPTRIKGWGSNGAVFENLIRKVRPRIVIEVGTFLGASAIHMAEVARRVGLGATQILCLDDFRGWPGFREHRFLRGIPMVSGDALLLYQFLQNVVQNGSTAAGSILPVPFSTGSGLEAMCEWGVFGDLIEIDAGHDFHSAWSDINRAYKILSPGGAMFGHDYFTAADNQGVRRAVDLFARVKGLKVRVDGQHWVIDSD